LKQNTFDGQWRHVSAPLGEQEEIKYLARGKKLWEKDKK
jgi:hypothetical protein